MVNLFDIENPASGFRLETLEMFNWGTFDQKIWCIRPNGRNSLLTGANGSGKTTLVDAIVSLLVPPARRYYNQSSGTQRKNERNEISYVKGAYKTLQYEGELSAKTQYLRTTNDFSVILGVFLNQDTNTCLSLAQVRWFANNELKRAYIIAPTALRIGDHFNPVDGDGQWKNRLKQTCKAEIFTSFAQYSHRFAKVFGLKSEKALTLFSQTVGIKVIGNLNEFIRTHMLQENDVEDNFRKLRKNFDNLLSAHRAIEKAKIQLDLLQPVVDSGETFENISQRVHNLETAKEAVVPYFADRQNHLLTLTLDADKENLKRCNGDIGNTAQALDGLEQQKEDLITAISQDEVSGQIRLIEKELDDATHEKKVRQGKCDDYNRLAAQLNLPCDPDEALFRQTAAQIRVRKDQQAEKSRKSSDELGQLKADLRSLQSEFDVAFKELKSLRERNNNIPLTNLDLRRKIKAHMGLAENEIPFGGELIRLKETARDWENAVERLLHNFGLALLVPEKYYHPLNTFVKDTDLKGRVVYHQVTGKIRPDLFDVTAPDSLINKLEVKSGSLFTDWIADHIRKHYNYICTKNLQDFERLDKALTPEGLIKNRDRHEKDDRLHIISPDNYVLGWDNREKIQFFAQKVKVLSAQIKATEEAVDRNTTRRQDLDRIRDALSEMAVFKHFRELDWKSRAALIEDLKAKRQKLLASSDKLQALKDQLTETKKQIEVKKDREKRLIKLQYAVEERIKLHTRQFDDNKRRLAAFESIDLDAPYQDLASYLPGADAPLTLENINAVQLSTLAAIDKDLDRQRDEKNSVEKQIIRHMGAFINSDPSIREKYPDWTAETANLRQDPAYLDEYRTIHARIKTEDLPRYKKRFKNYLNEQVVLDIANFKTTLDNFVADIKNSIKEINLSLAQIDYNRNPTTYIKLIEKDENDVRIRDFKQMLREAMPDAAKLIRGDEQELEYSFLKIQSLITKMTDEIEWRRYVTDVRNWLRFAAEEKYRADDVQKQYYADSQSLSGGEKAKLAYTILASAIAYQFGIQQKDFRLKSFRFVVVDEAFSKVDPENSVYAMELFKKLNLQLMLVTPLDRINLAERYIHAVHYVENKNQRDSAVYDMTIEEYHLQKEAFQQTAALVEEGSKLKAEL